MKTTNLKKIRHRPSQHGATLLITTVSAAFGVGLIAGTQMLDRIMEQSAFQGSATVTAILAVLGLVFFSIAVFVGGLVVSNAFSIVVAGRMRELALLRLIGASARVLRRNLAREGLAVGTLGGLLGSALSLVAAVLFAGHWEQGHPGAGLLDGLFTPLLIAPMLLVATMAWAAAWTGARPALTVAPIQALQSSVETPAEPTARRKWLLVLSATAVALGLAVLALGTALGSLSPSGVLVAVLGGILSFTGIACGAAWVMPIFLRAAGSLLGHGPAGRLATGTTRRHPRRSARTSMGLVIGMTLVVMFATAAQTFKAQATSLYQEAGMEKEAVDLMNQGVDQAMLFLDAMMGFSVLIAVVGVANTMLFSVLQRRRELGLLRTIGLSRAQTWAMVSTECAQMVLGSALLALPLGVLYGWCGAQSLLGSVEGIGFFLPTLPWLVLAVVLLGGLLITAVATALPVTRVLRQSPVQALAAA